MQSDKNQLTWEKRIKILAGQVKKGSTILDVGCGDGSFIYLANKAGYAAIGLDKSKIVVSRLKKIGLCVYQNFSNLKSKQFDAVTAFDVLEHVPNPEAFLRLLKKHLKPGGIILLTTPNEKSLGGRLLKNRFWGLSSKGHQTIFNSSSLRLLFKKAGFSIQQISTDTLAWWYLTDSFLINKIFNKFVYLLRYPFQKIIFKLGLGDNLQIIAFQYI